MLYCLTFVLKYYCIRILFIFNLEGAVIGVFCGNEVLSMGLNMVEVVHASLHCVGRQILVG